MELKDTIQLNESFNNSIKKSTLAMLEFQKGLGKSLHTLLEFQQGLQKTVKSSSDLGKHLEKTSKSSSSFGKHLEQASKSASTLRGDLKDVSKSASGMEHGLKSIKKSASSLDDGLKSAVKSISGFAKSSGKASKQVTPHKGKKSKGEKNTGDSEEKSDRSKGLLSGIGGGLMKIAGGLIGALASGIGGLISKGVASITAAASKKIMKNESAKAAFEKIGKIKSMAVGILSDIVASAGITVMSALNGPLKAVLTWLQHNKGAMTGFVKTITSAISTLAPYLSAAFYSITNALMKLFAAFGAATKTDGLKNFMTSLGVVIANVGSLISSCIRTLTPVIVSLWGIIQQMIGWVVANMPMFLNAFNSVLAFLGPKLMDVANVIQFLWQAWMQIWPTLSSIIQTAWGVIQPILQTLWDLMKIIVDIVMIAWPLIKPVIEAVWAALKPVIEILGKAFEWVSGIVGAVRGWFDEKAKESMAANGMTQSPAPKPHAIGLARVPYDNYPALLHEGERVLTRQETSNQSNSVSISKLADTIVVREEADIDKIANALAVKLRQYSVNMGVA